MSLKFRTADLPSPCQWYLRFNTTTKRSPSAAKSVYYPRIASRTVANRPFYVNLCLKIARDVFMRIRSHLTVNVNPQSHVMNARIQYIFFDMVLNSDMINTTRSSFVGKTGFYRQEIAYEPESSSIPGRGNPRETPLHAFAFLTADSCWGRHELTRAEQLAHIASVKLKTVW